MVVQNFEKCSIFYENLYRVDFRVTDYECAVRFSNWLNFQLIPPYWIRRFDSGNLTTDRNQRCKKTSSPSSSRAGKNSLGNQFRAESWK